MKIKIKQCSDPLLWYNTKLGAVFQVEQITFIDEQKTYWCREGGMWNCLNYVLETDAEIYYE